MGLSNTEINTQQHERIVLLNLSTQIAFPLKFIHKQLHNSLTVAIVFLSQCMPCVTNVNANIHTSTHTHTTHSQAATHIYALTMVNAVCVLACSPHHSKSNNNSRNNSSNDSSNTRWSGSLVKYLQNFVKGPAALISSRAVQLFVQSLSLSPTVRLPIVAG